MDKRKKIAYLFFELNNDRLLEIINNGIEKRYVNDRFILEFEFLFGIKDTLEYFIEWIVNDKKINLPDPIGFCYSSMKSLRQQGLGWVQILQSSGLDDYPKWVYSNGKIIEGDNIKVSQ